MTQNLQETTKTEVVITKTEVANFWLLYKHKSLTICLNRPNETLIKEVNSDFMIIKVFNNVSNESTDLAVFTYSRSLLHKRGALWCAADAYNYMCHICAKEFSDSKVNKAVIDKISFFHEIAPNFTCLQKS